MRSEFPVLPLAASFVTGFVLVASIILSPDLAFAADDKSGTTANPSCTCPDSKAKGFSRPKFAGLEPEYDAGTSNRTPAKADTDTPPGAAPDKPVVPRLLPNPGLDDTDEVAALESIQFALNEIGDRSSYVWHRRNGRISGVVQPTSSFKDAAGKVCRHVVVVLTSGAYSKKTEGVACRLAHGVWQLDG